VQHGDQQRAEQDQLQIRFDQNAASHSFVSGGHPLAECGISAAKLTSAEFGKDFICLMG
jgi:hypothetical protein